MINETKNAYPNIQRFTAYPKPLKILPPIGMSINADNTINPTRNCQYFFFSGDKQNNQSKKTDCGKRQ